MKTEKYTREVLEEAAKKSTSIAGVMRYVKCPMTGGSRVNVVRRLKMFEIDISHFKSHVEHLVAAAKVATAKKKLMPEDILRVSLADERVKGYVLKRALLETGRPYKCARCHIENYNNEEILLEVDHVDGDWKNNTRENLQFLCPNCHSQKCAKETKYKYSDAELLDACRKSNSVGEAIRLLTGKPRWQSKIANRIKVLCQKENIVFHPNALKFPGLRPSEINPLWRKAPKLKLRKVARPSREELSTLLRTHSYCAVGRMYGVTDNAVRKWAKQYNFYDNTNGNSGAVVVARRN